MTRLRCDLSGATDQCARQILALLGELLMPLGSAVASAGWMSRGACQREDPELFFPISDGAAHLAVAAKAVCKTCPVRASCLAIAVETRQDGIWGGTTSDERYAMRNQASPRRITGRTVSTGHACR
jgi:WhiB family transcriptional regulator, redox-sensing transcriptional regulator